MFLRPVDMLTVLSDVALRLVVATYKDIVSYLEIHNFITSYRLDV